MEVFFFMIFAFTWIGGSLVASVNASHKKIGGAGAFFISFFFSPLIGLLVVIASPETEYTIKLKTKYQEDQKKAMINAEKKKIESANS